MPFNQYRNREIARLTCLRAFAGRDSIASAVFDASTLVADSNGRYSIPIGSFCGPMKATKGGQPRTMAQGMVLWPAACHA